MFDPYHRWLGIPRSERPPTYYQLLGVSPEETDPEVIEEAALRQTSHVRTYQTGPYAEMCKTILAEIGKARATLLNRDKRRDYDARLSRSKEAPREVEVETIEEEVINVELVAPAPVVMVDSPARPLRSSRRRLAAGSALDRRDALMLILGAGSLLVLEVLALALIQLIVLLTRRESESEPSSK